MLGGALVLPAPAEDGVVELPEFRVEGTPWKYARLGDMEILTRAPAYRTSAFVAGILRGQRMLPDFVRQPALPLYLILVQEEKREIAGLAKARIRDADLRRWPEGYVLDLDGRYDMADERTHLIAVNLSAAKLDSRVFTMRALRLMARMEPRFPHWVLSGLGGECGPLTQVIGVPHSTSVRLSKLSWPDPMVTPGEYPAGAADFPAFAEMFDPARDPATMSQEERWKFEFQCGLFARWSLFGPAKKGRDRNGFWAFAEMARRGQATEEVFRECYQMDWPAACVEMRRYLKSKGTGMIEVRMPQVMAGVPEADALQFSEASPEDVKRILGDFRRLRERQAASKPSGSPR